MATKPADIRPGEIPDEFFTALAFLIPYLNRIAQSECGLEIGNLLVMMHLTISGEPLDDGRTMLRQDLTKLLLERGFSQAGASRLLQGLEEDGLVRRAFIPAAVRQQVFEPAGRTNTLAVILTEAGATKIDEFKTSLRKHFGHWLVSESRKQRWLSTWIRRLLPTAIKLAKSLIDRIAHVEN